MALELAGRITAACKDGGAVAEIALVANRDCFVQIFGSHDGQNGAKDLFFPNAHFRLHFVDYARAQQEAFRVEFAPAIKGDRGAFTFGDIQVAGDAITMLGPMSANAAPPC
jgi:hypothetical protein